MANKDNTGEFSMDHYVNERLSEDVEPNNPFEITEGSAGGKKGSKLKNHHSGSDPRPDPVHLDQRAAQ